MNEENTDALIKVYLQYCQFGKGLSDKTIKAYRIDLTLFSNYVGGDITICDKVLMQNCLSHLHKRYKMKSVKQKNASLKAFLLIL